MTGSGCQLEHVKISDISTFSAPDRTKNSIYTQSSDKNIVEAVEKFGVLITLVATTDSWGYAHISNFKVEVEGELFCVEELEVHPGSDRTSRSVARNQVPREKSDI